MAADRTWLVTAVFVAGLLMAATSGTHAEEVTWTPDRSQIPWLPTLTIGENEEVCQEFRQLLVDEFIATGTADLPSELHSSESESRTFLATLDIKPEIGLMAAHRIDINHDGQEEIVAAFSWTQGGEIVESIRIFSNQSDLLDALSDAEQLADSLRRRDAVFSSLHEENFRTEIIRLESGDYIYSRSLRSRRGEALVANLGYASPDGQRLDLCSVATTPGFGPGTFTSVVPAIASLDDLLADIGRRNYAPSQCEGTLHPATHREYRLNSFEQLSSSAPWILLDNSNWHVRKSDSEYPLTLLFLAQWGEHSIWNWSRLGTLADAIVTAEEELAAHVTQSFGAPTDVADLIARRFVEGLITRTFAFGSRDMWGDAPQALPRSLDVYLSADSLVVHYGAGFREKLTEAENLGRQLRRGMLLARPLEELAPLIMSGAAEQSDGEPIASFALGHPEYLPALISAEVDLDAVNDFDKTALMYAAQLSETETASALLQHGAGVNLVTLPLERMFCGGVPFSYSISSTRTALDYAIQSGSQEIIDLLREHGAMTAAELGVENAVQH